jgi:hypothetical protein
MLIHGNYGNQKGSSILLGLFGRAEEDVAFKRKVSISIRLNFDYPRFSFLYSARKAITLIVKVANAGGAHIILVVFTVSSLLSA